ncbi:tyrosine--tRNA ligase [Aquibacillus sp. 3ASR75-11]|uniref:Tyrosine--tRNA ligase n=1 Tax=Terrihalobacillus insolitus TaxID=2950438 RepID=A0A9X3WVD8_9BACI|nr:tyrosine--tRNA ligase [Terrihalobacillus insolitus]MDC3412674.1 tyrosine--tRNA ligase [Terrihalobacillus insolitus]MDC3424024.1 tyrosine--tRNA ligase [Terrihalobacillus insolitus]
MNILEDLKQRGLVSQTTDDEGLTKHLEENVVTLYCGFDPTADSLHIGNLVQILILKRFQRAGHRPIALIGGGTGLIGDPSGRSTERSLNDLEVVQGYSEKIKQQLAKLLNFDDGENAAIARDNYEWLSNMTIIEFLRDTGKYFGVNYMLAKESVESRIENGISFTEFSYMILQSVDFLNLYEKENCTLQIGGSDQWGNITAGLELIRRTKGGEKEGKAFGLTVPLITKADGTKFGKTAGGAVWLDPEKTSPYEFYQFWINTDDRDVIKFIQYFTFLELEEIEELVKEVEISPEKRTAQTRLAEEMTKMVHGEESLKQAQRITRALFSGDVKELTAQEVEQGFKDVPSHIVSKEEMKLVELLVEAKITSSKRQAREDIQNGAIYINGERKTDVSYAVSAADRIDNQFTIIRRGKKKYFLLRFE